MSDPLPLSLAVKLGSLVVHVQELVPGASASRFDAAAAKALADDPEVAAWLATLDPVFLPARRDDAG